MDEVDFEGESATHGCVAHVINLAAKDGLAVFGDLLDAQEEEEDSPGGAMDIHNLVDPPDVSLVNLKTVYRRAHALVIATRKSPQRAQHFAQIVELMRSVDRQAAATAEDREALEFLTTQPPPNVDEIPPPPKSARRERAVKLIRDVDTRWNSSYLMFKRLLRLRKACDSFCDANKDLAKYKLTKKEWYYIEQMSGFLEPLSQATEQLCKSRYPTMHSVIPLYMVIIKGLQNVSLLLRLFFFLSSSNLLTQFF